MSDWDLEDPLTRLNTQLNKSMVLMENVTESSLQQNKSNKSIKISTKTKQHNSNTSVNGTHRKSILKKPETMYNGDRSTEDNETELDTDLEIATDTSLNHLTVKSSSRPYNLQELIQEETLTVESTSSILHYSDISDSEDMWIMDIPKTVDPRELIGQTLVLGDKSKFKIGEEKYCAVNRDLKHNVTCVFNTRKTKPKYKAVNIKPVGSLTIRKKLSSIGKVKPVPLENSSVPFPENVKTRHPLFGVISESKSRKSLKLYGSRNKKKHEK